MMLILCFYAIFAKVTSMIFNQYTQNTAGFGKCFRVISDFEQSLKVLKIYVIAWNLYPLQQVINIEDEVKFMTQYFQDGVLPNMATHVDITSQSHEGINLK